MQRKWILGSRSNKVETLPSPPKVLTAGTLPESSVAPW